MQRRSAGLILGLCLAVAATAFQMASGSPPAAAATSGFSISTTPAMQPPFSPSISDYAVRCAGLPTTHLTTTTRQSVTIGGSAVAGPAAVDLPLVAGQEVTVVKGSRTYYIRCLPSDFPTYTAAVTGHPKASGYLVTVTPYVVAFDPDGVPVWWFRDGGAFSPWDAKSFSATTIGWWDSAGFTSENPAATSGQYVLHNLDGSVAHTVGGAPAPLDFHDLTQMPNGDYLGMTDGTTQCPAIPSQCFDLRAWGQSAQSSVEDNVIVELNAANQIVWSWSAAAHIDVAKEDTNWRDQYPDAVHMNSVQYDGAGGIIFSARHLDAVYRIDMATGAITWKLGGTPTPQSLIVTGNQYAELFSGQHDARLTAKGTLTVHDNGTRLGHLARGIEFKINTKKKTATVVTQVTDPRSVTSICCGSAELTTGRDWVSSWGYNDYITELNAAGVPQLTITYPGKFSYRVGLLGAPIAALRAGMDTMVPPL
jgi:hypothetical protein